MILRICVIVLLLSTACRTLPPSGTAADWKLLWEDDFGKRGSPDLSKWSFAGRKPPDWACYCTDTSATTYVKNGRLYLKAMKSQDPSDTAAYQTGCLHTKDKFSFTYGKIEVKAKLPKGKGSWPAIWLMPQDSKYGGWPDSGEIDIMEHLNRDTIIYQTLHSHYIDMQKQKANPVYFATTPFKEGAFNIFGLEWYPDRLDFFVNYRKTFSYPKTANANFRQWPFDQAYYIILNQALGGKWVGSIDDRDLPVEMAVDWVRVYRKNDQR